MTTSPGYRERIQATAQKHWLGIGATAEQNATVVEIRRQYFETASEYYKAAYSLYDNLRAVSQGGTSQRPAFSLVNRNVQLFLSYAILWESFKHIYTAATYTHFALHGPSQAPLEDERTQIERVLQPPILTDTDFDRITLLRNGETADGAITSMVSRSSRELREFYGVADDPSLTDMSAFLQGVIEVEAADDGSRRERQAWVVQALDDAGRPIDPESPYSAEIYRAVIKWDCYQIRQNLNFVGKGQGAIDDAILILRAFCLLEPIVGDLLQDSHRAAIFAL